MAFRSITPSGPTGPKTYAHLVALGSSFAAGPSLPPIANLWAGRSRSNYAHRTAEALGVTLTDASISGATTQTVLRSPQRAGILKFPPQIEAVTPESDVDLVTITAGGNDLNYLGSISKAAIGGWLTEKPATRRLGLRLRAEAVSSVGTEDQIQAAAEGLTAIVDEVRLRAPKARILLVSYLTLFGPETRPSPSVPLSVDEIEIFRNLGAKVFEAFVRAAETADAELVDVTTPSSNHGLGSQDPWVMAFPTSPRTIKQTMFHPNLAGMDAVSAKIISHLSP